MGYLTQEELQAAQALHKDAPYVIQTVSPSQFSIARFYGGMRFQGHEYVYHPPTDECIRWDVFKMVAKMRKAADKERKAKSASAQMKLG